MTTGSGAAIAVVVVAASGGVAACGWRLAAHAGPSGHMAATRGGGAPSAATWDVVADSVAGVGVVGGRMLLFLVWTVGCC
jgi:hypothetical protein